MDDQYSLSDLRQFVNRATLAQFPSYPPQPDLFSAQQQPYEMVVLGRNMSVATTVDMLHHQQQHNNSTTTNTLGGGFHLHKDHHFNSDSTTTTATATATTNSGGFDGGDGGAARWPRQETLTLLEVRSRLDHKFKEANQKGPLWDEVARIMCEENGYQRTGKKCREKFENLYKYYKKTKEGKAGRQDGKHYRFFRQLEALYGDHNNIHHHNHHLMGSSSDPGHHIAGNVPHFHSNPHLETIATENPILRPGSSVSLSNSSDFETSSSDNDAGGSIESDESKKKKKTKRSWKAKIKDFIDHQMRKIMEKQEAWLEKMMTSMENREKERIEREETWRKHENERIEREHKFWANERAWIEARDSALMSALEKITNHHQHHHCRGSNQWLENEVTRLIQLRTSMESRFQQCGFSEEVLWEDIAAKMAYLGYDRSANVCKEKWDSLNKFFQEKGTLIRDNNEGGNKKRKEHFGEVSNVNNHNNNNTSNNNNNNSHCYSNHNNEGGSGGGLYMNHHHLGGFSSNCEINEPRLQLNEGSSSSPSSHNSNANVNVNVNVNINANNASVAGGSVMNDSCLRFFLGDGEGLGWEGNYGMKLNKNGGNHCD